LKSTTKKLQHLYQRAGFGLSPQEWQQRKNWSIETALAELFKDHHKQAELVLPNSPIAAERMMSGGKKEISEARKAERELVAQQNMNWVQRMGKDQESALLERMSLFWHGHFACESKIGKLAAQQLNSIRQHALGNFRDLVIAMAKDPAMIRYLNNQQNRKDQPNENFARELLELFTIGHGHYTEQDIKEAARAFTGWSSNLQGEYVFRSRQHDYGQKTFMGQTGALDGVDIIDIILEQKATARFIVQKIYRYFVNDQVDSKSVNILADQFYDSNYNIRKLMWRILSAEWFYDPKNRGSKIKSPIEFIAGIIRQLDVDHLDLRGIIGVQKALGQMLFKPPNVAGWPGGKSWIDNSTLMMRLQIAAALYQSSEVNFSFKNEPEEKAPRPLKKLEATINWDPIFDLVKGLEKEAIIEELSTYLLSTPITINKSIFLKVVPHNSRAEFIQRLCIRLMGLPEYQMC
jgi:uncharacterized protein (DUF1800 family)